MPYQILHDLGKSILCVKLVQCYILLPLWRNMRSSETLTQVCIPKEYRQDWKSPWCLAWTNRCLSSSPKPTGQCTLLHLDSSWQWIIWFPQKAILSLNMYGKFYVCHRPLNLLFKCCVTVTTFPGYAKHFFMMGGSVLMFSYELELKYLPRWTEKKMENLCICRHRFFA